MTNPNKKTNYSSEKTSSERAKRYIKRKTRYHFSLEGMECEHCGADAECRHHTTSPIEFDAFEFVCNKCHKEIHSNILNNTKKYIK